MSRPTGDLAGQAGDDPESDKRTTLIRPSVPVHSGDALARMGCPDPRFSQAPAIQLATCQHRAMWRVHRSELPPSRYRRGGRAMADLLLCSEPFGSGSELRHVIAV